MVEGIYNREEVIPCNVELWIVRQVAQDRCVAFNFITDNLDGNHLLVRYHDWADLEITEHLLLAAQYLAHELHCYNVKWRQE